MLGPSESLCLEQGALGNDGSRKNCSELSGGTGRQSKEGHGERQGDLSCPGVVLLSSRILRRHPGAGRGTLMGHEL